MINLVLHLWRCGGYTLPLSQASVHEAKYRVQDNPGAHWGVLGSNERNPFSTSSF